MTRQDYIELICRILRGSTEHVERPLPDPTFNMVVGYAIEADLDLEAWKMMCYRSLNGQAESIIAEVCAILQPPKPGEKADSARQGEVTYWTWKTAQDAMQPIEPTKWITKGVIRAGSINYPFGEGGSHKTNLMWDLAACISAGKNWLTNKEGKGGYECTKTPVLWIDLDNGPDLTHERLRASLIGHNLNPADTLFFWQSYAEPYFDASEEVHINALIRDIEHFGAGLVVLDNLSTISGGVDENSPAIGEVVKKLKRVAARTGAAIIVIHHVPKSGSGLRGHSRIRDNADLALRIERDGDSDVIFVSAEKVRKVPVEPFAAEWNYLKDANNDLISARFYITDKKLVAGKKESLAERFEAIINEHVPDGTNHRQMLIICKERGVTRLPAESAMKNLIKNGLWRQDSGPRGAYVYSRINGLLNQGQARFNQLKLK